MTNKLFEKTKVNLERTTQGLLTKKSDFVYADNDSFVPENKTYSVYYLTDKSKLYFTNLLTSNYVRQLIRVKDFDLYEQYTNIKSSNREIYPLNYKVELKDDDYSTGLIQRYFIQKGNDINAKVFEISEEDYNKKLTLYNKTSFKWVITGIKEDVRRQNTITIRNAERNYKGINKILTPLQYWRPSKDTPVTLEKKLSLLKKT